ncbi:MAG TPA: glycerol-3-phosphate acyltransferase [Saprospiraceae bacterium]|nr:glycerol-3-phosphate acyltransferase [Saprospiraceae bacterium]
MWRIFKMINLTHFWSIMLFALLLLFGYLLGSIPSGYLAGKWIKGIDLREYGSGTVSGSMVWEHVAKWAVVPVGLFDIFKGALPTWLGLRLGLGEVAAMLIGFAAIIGHNWPVYLNFQGGRGFSPFLGVLLALFPWGVPIILAGLGIGNIFRSPAIPLIVLVSLPIFAAFLNGSSIVLWLSVGMTVITVVKRLEANRRPLPDDPVERRNVILRRIFLDRDIQDHKSWIQREPHQHE